MRTRMEVEPGDEPTPGNGAGFLATQVKWVHGVVLHEGWGREVAAAGVDRRPHLHGSGDAKLLGERHCQRLQYCRASQVSPQGSNMGRGSR